MIKDFSKHRWLSNFAPCKIRFEGEVYPSVEHAYQAAKTTDKHARKIIQQTQRAGRAKWVGRRIGLRPDWEDIKVELMLGLLRQKFSGEPFRQKLLKTGKLDIQEGNTWNDTFWGVCLRTGKGQNMLGRLLMRVRDELFDEEGRIN